MKKCIKTFNRLWYRLLFHKTRNLSHMTIYGYVVNNKTRLFYYGKFEESSFNEDAQSFNRQVFMVKINGMGL